MGKTCTSEFFKKVKNCMSPKDECNLCVFEKLVSACFPQILRETILLLELYIKLYMEMIETR